VLAGVPLAARRDDVPVAVAEPPAPLRRLVLVQFEAGHRLRAVGRAREYGFFLLGLVLALDPAFVFAVGRFFER
jgi:hypothetical protein